jgi:hypothetical protein
VGIPLADVVQNGGSPSALSAVQPAGRAGGVTPSKFSAYVVVGLWQLAVAASSTSVVAVALDPSKPPAATSLLSIALPAINERGTFRLGPADQALSAGS